MLSDSLLLKLVLLVTRILSPFLRLRWATFDGSRIGHLIPEMDAVLFLYSQSYDSLRRRSIDIFVLPTLTPNKQIHQMYLRRFKQIPRSKTLDAQTSLAGQLLERPLSKLGQQARQSSRLAQASCGSPGSNGADVWGLYQGRPHVTFTPDELRRSADMALELGLDSETPYTCLHIRDPGYLTAALPGHDWSYHDYRNPPPESFVPVVDSLISRGIQVLRMGKFAAPAPSLEIPGLIDYANSHLRSDLLDVYLYSRCEFLIAGGPSGIDAFGLMFGRPALITNLVPFVNPGYGTETSIVLPALLLDRNQGRHLTLTEMLQYRFTKGHLFEEARIEVSYNFPDEISAATNELLNYLMGTTEGLGPEDEFRQEQFWSHADAIGIRATQPEPPKGLRIHRSRIGSDFLGRHHDLLMN